jgi:predicted nucleic acid-binding protein
VTQALVLDASAMVTLLISGRAAVTVARRIEGAEVHVPAHFDAEVLSALGRLQRSSELSVADVADRLDMLAAAPFERHAVAPLLASAWDRRGNVRLVDALYVALADELGGPLITLDRGLASACEQAELLEI